MRIGTALLIDISFVYNEKITGRLRLVCGGSVLDEGETRATSLVSMVALNRALALRGPCFGDRDGCLARL